MKNINVELDEQLYNEAQSILDEYGLDIEGVIKSTLKRVVRQGSAEFIFAKSAPSAPIATPADTVSVMSARDALAYMPAPVSAPAVPAKITKNIAKSYFTKRGHVFDAPVIFSSRNKATGDYWANPSVDTTRAKWYLILNDQFGKVLRLFEMNPNPEYFNDRRGKENERIDATTVEIDMIRLVPRADKPDLINLQIYGDDTTCFMDKVSGVMFRPYLIDEVNY